MEENQKPSLELPYDGPKINRNINTKGENRSEGKGENGMQAQPTSSQGTTNPSSGTKKEENQERRNNADTTNGHHGQFDVSKVVYVEPNFNLDVNDGISNKYFAKDLEDYSVYADLTIEVYNRDKEIRCQNGSTTMSVTYHTVIGSSGSSVSMHSGSKTQFNDGKEGTFNVLSTNYLNSFYEDYASNKGQYATTELFGINSIDISYDNYSVPKVVIKFTDIRGGSLFGPEELRHHVTQNGVAGFADDDIAGSFFKCFFAVPYPKFTLTVKGFYGDPVTYELTAADFRAGFDSANGNFTATVTLVGYTFAVLQDVSLNALAAAPYDACFGKNYWESRNFKVKDTSGAETVPMPRLFDIIQCINNFYENTDISTPSGRLLNEHETDNKTLNAYRQIKNSYEDTYNHIIEVFNKPLNPNSFYIISDDNQRGLLILINNTLSADTYEQCIKSFTDHEATEEKAATFGYIIDSINSAIDLIAETDINNYNAIFKSILNQAPTRIIKGIASTSTNADDSNTSSTSENQVTYSIDWNSDNGLAKHKDIDMHNTSIVVQLENLINQYNEGINLLDCQQYQRGWFIDTTDFLNILQTHIDEIAQNVKIKAKILSDAANTIVQDNLGFKPTLYNISKILFAHLETLMFSIDNISKQVLERNSNDSTKRTVSNMGLYTDKTDIVLAVNQKSKDIANLPIGPWPQINRLGDDVDTHGYKYDWIGKYPSNGEAQPEADFINGMISAFAEGGEISNIINSYQEHEKINQQKEEVSPYVPIPSVSKKIEANIPYPLCISDIVFKGNPFGNGQEETLSYDDVLGKLYMRIVNLLFMSSINHHNDTLINKYLSVVGDIDAKNFYSVYKDKIDASTLNQLCEKNNQQLLLKDEETAEIKTLVDNKVSYFFQPTTHSVIEIGNKHTENDTKIKSFPIINTNYSKDFQEGYSTTNSALLNCTYNEPNPQGYLKTLLFNPFLQNRNLYSYSEEYDEYMTNVLDDYLKNLQLDYVQQTQKDIFYGCESMINFNHSRVIKRTLGYSLKPEDGNGVIAKNSAQQSEEKYQNSCKLVEKTSNNRFDQDFDKTKTIKRDNSYIKVEDLTVSGLPYTQYTFTTFYTDKNHWYKSAKNSLFLCSDYYKLTDNIEKAKLFLNSIEDAYDIEESFKILQKKKTCSLPLGALLCCGRYVYEYIVEKEYEKNKDYNGYIANFGGELNTFLAKTLFETWATDEKKNSNFVINFHDIQSAYELHDKDNNVFNYEQIINIIGQNLNDFGQYSCDNLSEAFFENYQAITCNKSHSQVKLLNREDSKAMIALMQLVTQPCELIFPFYQEIDKNKNQIYYCKQQRSKELIQNYLNAFLTSLGRLNAHLMVEATKETTEENVINKVEETQVNDDIKLALYLYIKTLYDKWFGPIPVDNWTLDKYFETHCHFIDSFYNDIGDYAVINIEKFIKDLIASLTVKTKDFISFFSIMLQSNRMSLHCVQNFLDLNTQTDFVKRMNNMFKPKAYIDIDWSSLDSRPHMVFLYTSEPSTHLHLNGAYHDDSFMLNNEAEWPKAVLGKEEFKDYPIPAFGVTYGSQYQSYFTNMSIDMNSPRVTEQSIMATYNISQMNSTNGSEGGRQIYFTGQDLYTIYANNSYNCSITMMGCAWIQPLMYFVLLNVPLFRGSFIIYKVRHNITQGNMTTTFEGMRMANTMTPFVNQWANSKANSSIPTDSYGYNYADEVIGSNCEIRHIEVEDGEIESDQVKTLTEENGYGNLAQEHESNGNTERYSSTTETTIMNNSMLDAMACVVLNDAQVQSDSQSNELKLKLIITAMYNVWCKNKGFDNQFFTEFNFNGINDPSQFKKNYPTTFVDVQNWIIDIFQNTPISLVQYQTEVEEDNKVNIYVNGQKTDKFSESKPISKTDVQQLNMFCSANTYKSSNTLYHNCKYILQHQDLVFLSKGTNNSNSRTTWETKKDEGYSLRQNFIDAFQDAMLPYLNADGDTLTYTSDNNTENAFTITGNDNMLAIAFYILVMSYYDNIQKCYWICKDSDVLCEYPQSIYVEVMPKYKDTPQKRIIAMAHYTEKDRFDIITVGETSDSSSKINIAKNFGKTIQKRYFDKTECTLNSPQLALLMSECRTFPNESNLLNAYVEYFNSFTCINCNANVNETSPIMHNLMKEGCYKF